MAATTTASRKAPALFTGKLAIVRTAALDGVASLAFAEGKSRADVIEQLRIVLGKAPTAAHVEATKTEYVIGRVAAKLYTTATPIVDQMATARDIVLHYAAPAKDGVKARPLRKGQKGRRTPEQHKAVRASEEAWSQLKAEVLPEQSKAQTTAERNKAKRAPAMAGATARGKDAKAGTGVTHSELVKPDGKPMDRAAAVEYLNNMAATMLAFCNKHAGVVPTDYGTAVNAFKRAADKASIANAALADSK